MPNYRRADVKGGAFFFTVALANRSSKLLVEEIARLRRASWIGLTVAFTASLSAGYWKSTGEAISGVWMDRRGMNGGHASLCPPYETVRLPKARPVTASSPSRTCSPETPPALRR